MNEENGADASLEPEVNAMDADAEVVETDNLESEAESPPAEESETKPDPFQVRIDKLTKQFREEQRNTGSLSDENKSLKAQIESLQASQQAPAENTVKSLADFDYDESKYSAYLFEAAETRAAKVARETAEKYAGDYTRKSQESARDQAYEKRESEFAKSVDDFDSVAKDRYLPVSKAMADEIKESDVGPEMLYFLGKHPEEAAEIARMPERQAIRRMISLEAQMKSDKATAQGKKVSSAPPPPARSVRGSEPGLRVSTTDPASDKMSDEEWFKRDALRTAKKRAGG